LKLRLGINTGFLARLHPLAEDWLGMVAGELDCDMVQFSWDMLDLSTPEETALSICSDINDAALEQSVDIATTFTGHTSLTHNLLLHPDVRMRDAACQWYNKMVRLTAVMGASATGGHIGTFSEKDVKNRARMEEIGEDIQRKLAKIAEAAAEYKLDYIMVEPSPNPHFMPSDPEHALKWSEETSMGKHVPIYLCPDTAHLIRYQDPEDFITSLYDALELLAPVSPVVHVRQTDGKPGNSWPFTAEFNSKGAVDGERLVEALERGGATRVSLVLEPMLRGPQTHKFLEDIRESVSYWKEYV